LFGAELRWIKSENEKQNENEFIRLVLYYPD